MFLAEVSEWTLRAKCRDMADALFPEGKDQKRARTVCAGCPVRSECLAEALDNRIEWGALTINQYPKGWEPTGPAPSALVENCACGARITTRHSANTVAREM